jgi:hypothetical protein
MRRLHPPTLAQWGCDHQWKTTTSRPGGGEILRVRYLVCRRCGLRVKSEERLAVPWDETDLVAQVKALLTLVAKSYAAFRAAKGEQRVFARGVPANHSPSRTKFRAAAVARCCKRVLASPQ